ncbi:uncharacterized protein L969DRAFT_42229 [Mixia osmundae IAM 14324]|uniref:Exocyst complex component Sec8 n=1 Tax=Mixia osmundae (strain CBS 9802 / IAM 14324 / JCM 22182 / KY 12970) TaxID=764103 RepID=G7E406_MIXOS|nr:uncharacterized protein L969DRAFT_42229 [Mixia osmundae IAM 14324]KEI42012.1 hypothetical protein L969DRAFT_42229 [Mixia osmundae IAM 14324]GAA97566.1 hypothetical protein E5Q_04244 [Mixia osmundae IAM 14324]
MQPARPQRSDRRTVESYAADLNRPNPPAVAPLRPKPKSPSARSPPAASFQQASGFADFDGYSLSPVNGADGAYAHSQDRRGDYSREGLSERPPAGRNGLLANDARSRVTGKSRALAAALGYDQPVPQLQPSAQTRGNGALAVPRRRRGSGDSASSASSTGSAEPSFARTTLQQQAGDISASIELSRSRSNARQPRPPQVPTRTASQNQKSVQDVLSAFSAAGQRNRAKEQAVATGYDSVRANVTARKAARPRRGTDAQAQPPDRALRADPAFADIERVMHRIHNDWPVLLPNDQTDAFDPVTLALELIDDSTQGRRMRLDAFAELQNDVANATKQHIQKHYRALDASVTAYNGMSSGLNSAQREVGGLRSTLRAVKEALGSRRTELAALESRRTELAEMERILDSIDQIKAVPDKLETLMSEKRFLAASVLLVRSLRLINKPELAEIGAIADLRAYLIAQETALLEILVDELHAHLYLKSFYCESRWRIYQRGQTALPPIDGSDTRDLVDKTNVPGSTPSLRVYLRTLSMQTSYDPVLEAGADLEEATSAEPSSPHERDNQRANPETDSFAYIEMLLESANSLGKLSNAIDAVCQRTPQEIYSLVDATIDEVGERTTPAPAAGQAGRPSSGLYIAINDAKSTTLPKSQARLRTSLLRLGAADGIAAEANAETLRDLFWTLYSKLDAAVQGFRVAYEVCLRINQRRGLNSSNGVRDGLLQALLDVWKPVQTEVRALLNDYLTGDEQATVSSRFPMQTINEILRAGRYARNASKPLYRSKDSDGKERAKELKAHEDSLMRALRASVPGLVTSLNEATSTAVTSAGDERYGFKRIGETHRILLRPDAFNVSILFGPTLAFLDRIREVLPDARELSGTSREVGATEFGGFLDDFVEKTFLPQLEEKVLAVFNHAVNGSDAFQDAFGVSEIPIYKSVISVVGLISNLCAMLRNTPFHRDRYSDLIISVIVQYYQCCEARFKETVSSDSLIARGPSKLKTSAMWTSKDALATVINRLRTTAGDDAQKSQLLQEELRLHLQYKGTSTGDQLDYVPVKKAKSMSTLYASLDWFREQIKSMQGDKSGPESDTSNALPFSKDYATRFDALLKTYRKSSEYILAALRTELRVRCLCFLDRSAREGNYQLDSASFEPDLDIIELNSELTQFDDALRSALAPAERSYLMDGLPLYIDSVLVYNVRYVRSINSHGLAKIMRNILALQQNLKNLGDRPLDVNFDSSRAFWQMLNTTATSDVANSAELFVARLRSSKTIPYDVDSLKALLALTCGLDPATADTTTALPDKRKAYGDALLELYSLGEW